MFVFFYLSVVFVEQIFKVNLIKCICLLLSVENDRDCQLSMHLQQLSFLAPELRLVVCGALLEGIWAASASLASEMSLFLDVHPFPQKQARMVTTGEPGKAPPDVGGSGVRLVLSSAAWPSKVMQISSMCASKSFQVFPFIFRSFICLPLLGWSQMIESFFQMDK